MNKDDPYITESSLRRILAEAFAEFRKDFKQEIIQEIAQEIQASEARLYRRITDEFSEVLSDFAAHVDARFTKIEKQLEAMAIANQARDIHITRHERWHYLTAKKLRISLPQDI